MACIITAIRSVPSRLLYRCVSTPLATKQTLLIVLSAVDNAFKADPIHHDISIENVVSVSNDDSRDFVGGILNDWDHSGYTEPTNEICNVRRSVSLMAPTSNCNALR